MLYTYVIATGTLYPRLKAVILLRVYESDVCRRQFYNMRTGVQWSYKQDTYQHNARYADLRPPKIEHISQQHFKHVGNHGFHS